MLHIALSALAAATLAAAPVDAAFGNTIISTYPDGRTALLWLQRDGSYSAQGRRRTPSSGRWSIKGEKLCLKQARPVAVPMAFCTPLPPSISASAWPAKAVTGEVVSVRIAAGKVTPKR